MPIDNFELIKSILEFRSDDDFYFLQIIKRKKDFPDDATVTGTNNNNRCIKTYLVGSVDYLNFREEEIKSICDVTGARACIDLNRRSYEKMAFHNLKKVADQVMNKDYTKVYKSYPSVCGQYSNEKADKKWILDIDKKLTPEEHSDLKKDLFNLQPHGDKLKYIIPSLHGIHYITNPFKLQDFSKMERWSHITIHKRNPTNIYIPEINAKT